MQEGMQVCRQGSAHNRGPFTTSGIFVTLCTASVSRLSFPHCVDEFWFSFLKLLRNSSRRSSMMEFILSRSMMSRGVLLSSFDKCCQNFGVENVG